MMYICSLLRFIVTTFYLQISTIASIEKRAGGISIDTELRFSEQLDTF